MKTFSVSIVLVGVGRDRTESIVTLESGRPDVETVSVRDPGYALSVIAQAKDRADHLVVLTAHTMPVVSERIDARMWRFQGQPMNVSLPVLFAAAANGARAAALMVDSQMHHPESSLVALIPFTPIEINDMRVLIDGDAVDETLGTYSYTSTLKRLKEHCADQDWVKIQIGRAHV